MTPSSRSRDGTGTLYLGNCPGMARHVVLRMRFQILLSRSEGEARTGEICNEVKQIINKGERGGQVAEQATVFVSTRWLVMHGELSDHRVWARLSGQAGRVQGTQGPRPIHTAYARWCLQMSCSDLLRLDRPNWRFPTVPQCERCARKQIPCLPWHVVSDGWRVEKGAKEGQGHEF